MNTPAANTPVTPVGKPVTVAPVPPPPMIYLIVSIAIFCHTVCTLFAVVNDKLAFGSTLIVPVKVFCKQVPVVVTV